MHPYRIFWVSRLAWLARHRARGQAAPRRLGEPPDRHHDHRQTGEWQAALDGRRSLVVEDTLAPALLLEDQLAGEEGSRSR
jgi:hypothetical protein